MAALEQGEAFETVAHQTTVGRWSPTPIRPSPYTQPIPISVACADHAQLLAELHRIASDQFRGVSSAT
jgi:hypothetical protein